MENKIALSSFANLLAQSTGKSRKLCEDFLREFFRLVSETLVEGESIKIKGFGSFKLSEVESRTSVNVNSGEPIEIPAYKKVVFSPAKELAAAINAPFQEFESVEMDDDMPEDMVEEEENITKSEEEVIEIIDNEENISDENLVGEERLEVGSDEEGEDDELTYEAYKDIEEQKTLQETPMKEPEEKTVPPSPQENVQKIRGDQPIRRSPRVVAPVPVRQEEPKKSRFGIGFLTGALKNLVVCVVVFMLGCFFDWWPVNFGSAKEVVAEQPAPETSSFDSDEFMTDEVESTPESEPVYDTVSTTRYLTTISRDHYGNYNFWPYIYLENESILGHPDRITPGTKVVVPDLSKYGVDPSKKEDVEAAKKKAFEIYSKFK